MALHPPATRSCAPLTTANAGFDDVIVLGPRSAHAVGEAAKQVARRGTFNVVSDAALDGPVQIDVGRIHYDYNRLPGEPRSRRRSVLRRRAQSLRAAGGWVALFVGAAGPMGQMHVQRALELGDGPAAVIASDTNPIRLAAMIARLGPLAEACGRRLIPVGPDQPLAELVAQHNRRERRRRRGGLRADCRRSWPRRPPTWRWTACSSCSRGFPTARTPRSTSPRSISTARSTPARPDPRLRTRRW